MSVEYTIGCDECGRLIDASRVSAAAARLVVRNMGGKVNLPGGKDLCNYCVAQQDQGGSRAGIEPAYPLGHDA